MIHRKRTQKDITDPKILLIWEEVKEETRRLFPQYFQYCEPELYQDSSYAHLGRCSQSYRNGSTNNVNSLRANRCIITISSLLGQDYDEIRDTLCHELGHFVAPGEVHSRIWEHRANQIGQKWGIKVGRLGDNEAFDRAAVQARMIAESRSQYKYRLFCPECGVEWKYKTNCAAVQRPERYCCGKCKVKLQSEEIWI